MIRTAICDLFEIEYPIIQAGMGPADTTLLAIATSNAGALGLISGNSPLGVLAGQSQYDNAMDCIRKAMSGTDKPFGFNIPINAVRAREVMRAMRDARKRDPKVAKQCRIIFTSAGDATPYIPELHEEGMICAHVVPTVYHAQKMEQAGIDVVVASGYEGGGHVNPDPVNTLVLVPAVVEAVKVPVIATGGIGDAKSFVAALALGAQGVQMGTRFLATQEAGVHQKMKERILQAGTRDTVVTKGSLGPARGLKNRFTETLNRMMAEGASEEDIERFKATGIGEGRSSEGGGILRAIWHGDVDNGFMPAGQVAGRVHDLPTVKELVERIMRESEELIGQLARQGGGLAR